MTVVAPENSRRVVAALEEVVSKDPCPRDDTVAVVDLAPNVTADAAASDNFGSLITKELPGRRGTLSAFRTDR